MQQCLAQDIGIGNWYSLFPYNTATGAAFGDHKAYGGRYGLLEYNTLTGEYTNYTKVNGLSDVNIVKLAYAEAKKALIITYESSDIDIFQEGIFYNVPDLKNANIAASKKINNVTIINNDAYISSGVGILVVNIDKHEVKATYPMVVAGAQSDVYDVALQNNKIIALTNKGIFKADVNNDFLQNIDNWTLVNPDVYKKILVTSDSVYIANDSIVYSWDGFAGIHFMYQTDLAIKDMLISQNKLNIAVYKSFGKIIQINKDGSGVNEIGGLSPQQLAVDDNDKLWMANTFTGLDKLNNIGDLQNYKIGGPYSLDAFNLRFINNSLYIIGGAVAQNYNFLYKRGGVNKYSNYTWKSYTQWTGYPQMDSIFDILDVEENKITKSIYFASYGGGFLEIDKDGAMTQLARNSVIQSANGDEYAWLVTNLKMDANNNLWATVTGAINNLMVLKKDGAWQAMQLPNNGESNVWSQIEIDNIGQKWIIKQRNGGLLVYNDNQTIENLNDDRYYLYTSSPNNGNLASNNVRCIAKDNDGKIWVGTDNGISIINCPENALESGGCPAENKIVQYDIAAGKLFQDEYVTTIAVDGANRKWVGSANGVWLLSADAEKIILHFDKNNSPLPTNDINKIAIDPNSGIVYFATQNGVVGYRSTATDGATEIIEPLVYPNPITSDYIGTIAIKGLIENADVRIIDAAGQLVYRTVALGGQAIWNGKTYSGAKPQSGVYYVLATNADGSVTQKTKFVFVH
jgi:hypothetical protein